MKTKLSTPWIPIVSLLCLTYSTGQLSAQGTAFTYQGRLTDNGSPASGSYDFRVRLASDALGNNFVAGPLFSNAVPVSGGLFTLRLDFGAGIFTGSNYWLQLDVKATNVGSYSTLTPLQALTPSPYAIFAGTASNLSGTVAAAQLSGALPSAQLAGTYSSAVTLNNAANNFTGNFSGSGAGLSNLNATTLGGVAASNLWQLGGNNVAAGQFLGSTNNQPVDIRVRGSSALRLQPTTNDAPNIVGGAPGNLIASNVVGSIIGGGGGTNVPGVNGPTNYIGANYSVVGGGAGNRVEDSAINSFIGGGSGNIIAGVPNSVIGGGSFNQIQPGNFTFYATIGGGSANFVSTIQGTIGGGNNNQIGGPIPAGTSGTFLNFAQLNTIGGGGGNFISPSALGGTIAGGAYNFILGGENSTIGGGLRNTNSGSYSTIPGGDLNFAVANSFAAGHRARAENPGTFVWADSQNSDFSSTANNQYLVRAAGGVGINTNNPGATLDVNGSLRVGFGTTIFRNLQAGVAQQATDSATVKTNFTFSFPKAFTSVPNVIVSALSASDVDDTFAVTVRRVTTTTCTVNVTRTDTAAGWGQHVKVTWLAWE
jgi:hypothetical protein